MFGIMTSRVIATGCSDRAIRSAARPSLAVTTRTPAPWSVRPSRSSAFGSSSTTSTIRSSSGCGEKAASATGWVSELSALTSTGSRIVKVEPSPSLLSTVISPPIISQKRFVMARPRPVPPKLRVVLSSACENSSKTWSIFSGGIPMPVSETEMRNQLTPFSCSTCAESPISP